MASKSGGYGAFSQGNTKYGPSTAFDFAKDMSPDLMLKVSKKIAQLTKVIYSLNTKNEDMEEITASLKESYDEEIKRVYKEFDAKLANCNNRLSIVTELENTVSSLRSALKEARKERDDTKEKLQNSMTTWSKDVEKLEMTFARELEGAKKELTSAKTALEDSTKAFEEKLRELEGEKDKVLAELSHRHAVEMEELIKAHRIRYNEVEKSREKLRQELEVKRDETSEDLSISIKQKIQLEEEFNSKLEKMKSFYEKEIEVVKNRHSDELAKFNLTLNKSKQDYNQLLEKSRTEFEKQLLNMKNSMSEKDETIKDLYTKISLSNDKDMKQEKENAQIRQEQANVQRELGEKIREIEKLKNSLSSAHAEVQEEKSKIKVNLAEIGTLEVKLKEQSEKVERLMFERETLETKAHGHQSELLLLQQRYEAMNSKLSKEMETICKESKQKEEEMERVTKEYDMKIALLQNHHAEEIRDLLEKQSGIAEKLKEDNATSYEQLTKRLTMEYETERRNILKSFQREKEDIVSEKNSVIEDLSCQLIEKVESLNISERRIEELDELFTKKNESLQVSEENVKLLEEEKAMLQRELTDCIEKAASLSNKILESEDKYKKLNLEFESCVNKTNKDHGKELEDVKKTLESKWSDRMSEEIKLVRETMKKKFAQEKEASLEQLREAKAKELNDMKDELEGEILQLQRMTSTLKEQLKTFKEESSKSELELNRKLNDQRKDYEEKLSALTLRHATQIADFEESNEKKVRDLAERHEKEIKELDERLRSHFHEDLGAQIQAGKMALEALRKEFEEHNAALLKDLQMKRKIEKDALREALYMQQQEEIEQVTREQEEKTNEVKRQLERNTELRAKEFEVHSSKIEELMLFIKEKETKIENLYEEARKREENVAQLNKELETKVEEIRIVRREANMQIRKREQQLAKAHRDEIDALTADHLREQQKLLAEFNRARGVLQEKITALQTMVESAEERFRNRESRVEDLEMIEELKVCCREKDLECKKHIEDKRYFQLELLNRETNFNKVFSSSPNVGIINPLEAGKKRKKVKEAWNSAGSNRTAHYLPREATPPRLEPLSNLRGHDQKLNNAKPLPSGPGQPGIP